MPSELDFAALQSVENGYLPLEDYGLIGDGATAALIGRDGSVGWLCAPRFDAPPLFCPLLDPDKGGAFRLAPLGCREGRHAYVPGTGVLLTELRGDGGTVRLADCLPLRADNDLTPGDHAACGGLLRRVEALDGPAQVELLVSPRARTTGTPLHWRSSGHTFALTADFRLRAEPGARPHVLYNLDGTTPPPEREDPTLAGYRGSRPVRWGNGAAEQRQHDVLGEVLDCAYQWTGYGEELPDHVWEHLCRFVETARQEWQLPDHGIWEVRTPGRPFTYSAALCQVAMDRGARIATRLRLPGDPDAWRRDARAVRHAILERAWNPSINALSGVLGAGDGLLFRYHPDQYPDGLPGNEGAFLLCSFWWVDNLALQGRLDEACALFDRLCARASPLGLLPEQVDPASGAFLGNFPQALSHVGLVSSAVTLAGQMG